ncbi:MAG: hypothetical protein WCK05_16130 [Planctomycetota bacterium]
MNRFSWLTGTLMLVAAVTFAQNIHPSDESPAPAATAPVVPVVKVPIPDAAALKKAGALANDVYGKDISKAKTAEAKAALGKKLLQSGIDEQGDLSTRWVLFDLAVDLAVQAADAETVFAATDELFKWFAVDALKWKADTLAKLERVKGADASVLAEHFARLIDEAIVADRYDVAKQVAELAVVVTRKSGDSGVVQAATARLQEVKTIEAGHEQAQKAQATLATDSNNTAAYLTAGRFLCFLKGDWEKGVPMLANSSDKALKAVADMEVAKPSEPAKQVELADGWWELAKKEQGLSQRRLREHAADLYKKALPSLTGVSKLKAQIRVEEMQESLVGGKPAINLLAMLQMAKDVVSGTWKAQAAALTSDANSFARVMLPYEVPEEYDLHVEFTRHAGGTVCIILCHAGREFVLETGWGGGETGFAYVGGKHIDKNETGTKFMIVNGRRHSFTVQVRKGGLQAIADGREIIAWKTDYHTLTPHSGWVLPNNQCVGFGSYLSPTTFHLAELIEITGKGKKLH